MLAGLRRRRVLMDSPRVLARDDREAATPSGAGKLSAWPSSSWFTNGPTG